MTRKHKSTFDDQTRYNWGLNDGRATRTQGRLLLQGMKDALNDKHFDKCWQEGFKAGYWGSVMKKTRPLTDDQYTAAALLSERRGVGLSTLALLVAEVARDEQDRQPQKGDN